MYEARGHYAAMLHGRAKRKPSVKKVSKRKLNMLDITMREAGYDEYDLGIIWHEPMWAWVLYAHSQG